MAKSRSSRRSSTSRGRRVTRSNANQRLPTPSSSRPHQLDLEDYLRSIEDRRTHHPDGHIRNARSFNRSTHSLKSGRQSRQRSSEYLNSPPPSSIGFDDPHKVLVCVRRKVREEVLHALKKTGKGGQKRPRRNPMSYIQC